MSSQDNRYIPETQYFDLTYINKPSLLVESGLRLGLVAPAPPVPGSGVSLPCLNSNNSIETDKQTFILSPYRQKATFTLQENVRRFVQEYGVNNVGFLTLTYLRKTWDMKEAKRKWNSLNTNFIGEHFRAYICTFERHKDGSWHLHLLVACKEGVDIKTGFDFKAVASRNYSSVCPYLRFELWPLLRENLKKYGFGRHELTPLKKNAEAVGKYVAKYLSKSWQGSEEGGFNDRGLRLVSYSQGQLRGNSSFSWNTDGAKAWRNSLKRFASLCNLRNMSDLSVEFGKRWAYHLRGIILEMDWLEGLIEKIPEQAGRFWYLGNDLVLDSDRGELFWDIPKNESIPDYVPTSKKIILAALSRIFGVAHSPSPA